VVSAWTFVRRLSKTIDNQYLLQPTNLEGHRIRIIRRSFDLGFFLVLFSVCDLQIIEPKDVRQGSLARSPLVFSDKLAGQLADATGHLDARDADRRQALEGCLRKLDQPGVSPAIANFTNSNRSDTGSHSFQPMIAPEKEPSSLF
jgi:hypothetical protein